MYSTYIRMWPIVIFLSFTFTFFVCHKKSLFKESKFASNSTCKIAFSSFFFFVDSSQLFCHENMHFFAKTTKLFASFFDKTSDLVGRSICLMFIMFQSGEHKHTILCKHTKSSMTTTQTGGFP